MEHDIDYKEIMIPNIFRSSATNSYFKQCISCNRDLFSDNCFYFIEKAIKRNKKYKTEDVIFEYAMCLECFENFYEKLSEESRNRIDNYYTEHVDLDKRRHTNFSKKEFNYKDWISSCLVKGTSIDKLEQFQIAGFFLMGKMIVYDFPLLISESAIDDIVELLSNKTIDELDDFTGKYLGPPPEFREFFTVPKVLVC